MESPDQKRLRDTEPMEVEGMTSAEYEEYEAFLAEPFSKQPRDEDEYIPVGRIAERDLWKELDYGE